MNVYAEHTHVGKNVMPVRSHKGKNNLGGSNMCLQIVGSYALVVRIERESEKRPRQDESGPWNQYCDHDLPLSKTGLASARALFGTEKNLLILAEACE